MNTYFISTISHNKQRYPTVGDWHFRKLTEYIDHLDIYVSRMNNTDYEFLVGIHELIEAYLCRKRGIKEEDVTKFDIYFEEHREENQKLFGDDFPIEPGNDSMAPYFLEHQFATKIEKLVAAELEIDWDEYDKTVNEL